MPPGKREWGADRTVGVSSLGGSQGLEQSHLILPLCTLRKPPSRICTALSLFLCISTWSSQIAPKTPACGLISEPSPPQHLSFSVPHAHQESDLATPNNPNVCVCLPPHPTPASCCAPWSGDGWSFDSADLGAVNHHPDDDRRVGGVGRDSD